MKNQKAIPPSSKKGNFLRSFKYAMPMVRAYHKGEYKKFPWKTVFGSLATVLYVLSPIDFIPEFIIGFGLLDDLAITALALKAIDMDVQDYLAWLKLSQEESKNELENKTDNDDLDELLGDLNDE